MKYSLSQWINKDVGDKSVLMQDLVASGPSRSVFHGVFFVASHVSVLDKGKRLVQFRMHFLNANDEIKVIKHNNCFILLWKIHQSEWKTH